MLRKSIIALVLPVFVFLTPVFGQSNDSDKLILNLQPDTLIFNLHVANAFDRETELDEIRNLYKLSVWHFAPGIAYDVIRDRIFLTISTSNLISHFVNKKVENRRIGAIERKYKAKDLGDELRIINLVRGIEKDYQDLVLAKKVVDIEIEIFLIHQQQFQENEIDTEKYLTSKRNIVSSINRHNGAVTNLVKQILNLSSICNSPLSADLEHLYIASDFIEI
jgi:hypothetical protein